MRNDGSASLRRPWKKLYFEAVLETDQRRLQAKVKKAESAIQNGLLALASSTDGRAERQAIDDAVYALQVLKSERLHSSLSEIEMK
jgi:hypothetical protein